jgi:hypothetical protein
MDASRRTVRARILEGQAKLDGQYPLRAGLADLREYFAEGTLNRAISGVTADAGAKEQAAVERIEMVANYGAEARQLSAYRTPDRVQRNADHEKKLLACLPAGSTSVDVTAAIHGPDIEKKKSLIACLRAAGETLN